MTIIAKALNSGSAIDYAWLLEYAKDWSHRSDMEARLPMFITLAEQRIKTLLLDRLQDTVAELSVTAGVAFTLLPTDLLHVRAVSIPDVAPSLDYITPEAMSDRAGCSPGTPRLYSIVGDRLYVSPTPDAAYSLSLTYTAAFPALTVDAPYNVLIGRWPDVYLWGVMREVAKYCRDAEMAGVYEADFQAAISAANLQSWQTPGSMQVRVG